MTDMDINAWESGHMFRQWWHYRTLADSLQQPADPWSAFDAKAGRCRADGAGNEAAHCHGGTGMRPVHILISGRGALVVVLIALFLTLARGQPSMVFPTSTRDIGTVEPVLKPAPAPAPHPAPEAPPTRLPKTGSPLPFIGLTRAMHGRWHAWSPVAPRMRPSGKRPHPSMRSDAASLEAPVAK